MTRATVASFNVKNLIGAEQEYYTFQSYTTEEHAWKAAWLADQIVTLDADVVGFQEIFEEAALRAAEGDDDIIDGEFEVRDPGHAPADPAARLRGPHV